MAIREQYDFVVADYNSDIQRLRSSVSKRDNAECSDVRRHNHEMAAFWMICLANDRRNIQFYRNYI